MNKKLYAKPTLDVVEYGMTQVICTSTADSVRGNVFDQDEITGGTGPARGNDRSGIWDED